MDLMKDQSGMLLSKLKEIEDYKMEIQLLATKYNESTAKLAQV